MDAAFSNLTAAWRYVIQGAARCGSRVAHWAAALSWSRLIAVCVLALVAESIVTNYVLNWREERQAEVARTGGAPDARDEGEVVDIGPHGITITEGRRHKPQVSPKDSDTGAGNSTDKGATPGAQERRGGGEPQSVLTTTGHSLSNSLSEIVEGLVLLLIVYLVAAKIVMRVAAKSDARAAEAEASAEREVLLRQVAQAQLQALQAQIEPHFLFNTLASVDYLIETDPARASAMQRNLIQYLRAALPQMRGNDSWLGREVDLVRAYLEILRVRMEERLRVSVDVPDGLRSAEFPPMMLQSLVENAIRHGIEPKPEGGEVRVSASVVDGQLEVAVVDSGVGLPSGGITASAGGGLGLANVRERLARLYPGRASFSLEPVQPSGVAARIRLPYHVAHGERKAETSAEIGQGALAK